MTKLCLPNKLIVIFDLKMKIVLVKFKNSLLTALFLSLGLSLEAQTGTTSLYQSGKIYVVVIVIAIVLAGFFLYLFRIDKKIKKIEDKINHHE